MTALPLIWPAGSMHDRKDDNTSLSYPEINAIGKSTYHGPADIAMDHREKAGGIDQPAKQVIDFFDKLTPKTGPLVLIPITSGIEFLPSPSPKDDTSCLHISDHRRKAAALMVSHSRTSSGCASSSSRRY